MEWCITSMISDLKNFSAMYFVLAIPFVVVPDSDLLLAVYGIIMLAVTTWYVGKKHAADNAGAPTHAYAWRLAFFSLITSFAAAVIAMVISFVTLASIGLGGVLTEYSEASSFDYIALIGGTIFHIVWVRIFFLFTVKRASKAASRTV